MYRHPHVFGDVEAGGAAEVEANWEQLKAAEKQRESVLDGVPAGLPALAYAAKLVSRVRRAGFTGVPDAPYELPAQLTADSAGRLLLAVAQRAHDADVDVDAALRAAARGYRRDVRAAEGLTD